MAHYDVMPSIQKPRKVYAVLVLLRRVARG